MLCLFHLPGANLLCLDIHPYVYISSMSPFFHIPGIISYVSVMSNCPSASSHLVPDQVCTQLFCYMSYLLHLCLLLSLLILMPFLTFPHKMSWLSAVMTPFVLNFLPRVSLISVSRSTLSSTPPKSSTVISIPASTSVT